VNDAGIFSTLEIRKAASLIHYYFCRQHVESCREATLFCCPKLTTTVMLFQNTVLFARQTKFTTHMYVS